jgi:hypothetical protein
MSSGAEQPIVEVDGKLQFSLPGQPIFPASGDGTILKPTLDWILYSSQPARFDGELSYVSGGMTWSADYNVVTPATGDTLELAGWVTLDNQSGRQFDNAHIKLMAGDVSKVQPTALRYGGAGGGMLAAAPPPPTVTEKTFEDYHLWTYVKCSSTERSGIPTFGSCASSSTAKPTTWGYRYRAAGCASTAATAMGRWSS